MKTAMIVSFVLAAGTVEAATRCVAPGGAGGCFTSVNLAIAAASAGDTITIAAGQYAENIVVDKPLTITGAGPDTVIVPALSSPNPCTGSSLCGGLASNIILVAADNVTIRHLTLDGDNPALTGGIVRGGADLDARNGIITNHTLGTFNNLTVSNVTVRNVYLRGMYASSGGTFNFDRNRVTNVRGDAYSIAMFNFGGSGRFTRNHVSNANDAISSNWSGGVQFLDNDVRESASGIHTDNAGGNGVGSGDLIAGNRIENGTDGSYGIFVFAPYVPVAVGDNRISDVEVGLSVFGRFAPVTPTFTDNVVKGRRTPGSAGVLVTSDLVGWGQADAAAAFDRNVIANFDNGFVIESAVPPGLDNWGTPIETPATITVTATCNDVRGSVSRDVVAGGLAPSLTDYPGVPVAGGGIQNITFARNNLNGRGVGVENRGAGTIAAEHNWWGCSGGPGGGGCDGIIGTVSVAPWLTRPSRCAVRDGDNER